MRQLVLLFVLTLALGFGDAWALSQRDGDFDYDTDLSNGAIITQYHGLYLEPVNVPSEYKGKPVISISNTFRYRNVKGVVLPETLKKIGDYAFEECAYLTNIQVPANVASIGFRAFRSCGNLKTLNVNGNTDLASEAFVNCTSLQRAFFTYIGSNSVTWHGNVFSGCSSLSQITIPKQVKTLPSGLFAECSAMTNVEVAGDLASIEVRAFYKCTSLSNLFFSNRVGIINSNWSGGSPPFLGAFQASRITNIIFKKEVGSATNYAFKGMPNLQSVSFFGDVGSVGSYAFEECPSLTNVVFYGGLKRIEPYAFANCNKLKVLILPDDLEYIGDQAFLNCTGLEKLIFLGNTRPTFDSFPLRGCSSNLKLYYPNGSADWSGYSNWYDGLQASPFPTNILVTWPQAESIQIGQRLSDVVLTNGSAKYAENGEAVPHSFSFDEPDFQPPLGTFTTNVVFTPELWYLGTQTKTISFRVLTNKPVVIPETITATNGWFFQYQVRTSNNPTIFSLVGNPPTNFFKNFQLSSDTGLVAGIPQKAGTANLTLRAVNSEALSGQADLLLQVTRGTPRVARLPTASAIRAGQPLSSSVLNGGSASNDLGTVPGKFTWLIPDRRPLAGTTSQDVRFTPSDLVNYRPATVSVSVQVLGITSPATLLTLTNGMAPAESLDIKVNFPAIRYEAFGLPPGLKLDAKTGQISGRPAIPNGSTLASYPTTLVAWRSQTESYSLQKTLVVAPKNALAYLDQFLSMLRPSERQP